MSLDRMQSQPGMTYVSPLPDASGNAGGLTVGGITTFAPATTSQPSGGAFSGNITPASATPTTIASSATITHNSCPVVFVTTAAAVTGVILQAGTQNGQIVTIIHAGAVGNTITFAASGTSNVAGGTAVVITGPRSVTLVWNARTNLWY